MRVFIAIGIPDDVAGDLSHLTRGLAAGRRMDPESMHLTLAFLGDATHAELEEVDHGLSGLALPGFDLRLEGLGTFGQGVRTLWIGAAPDDGLMRLQKKAVTVARRAGIQPERRRFVPHVTLARFREGEGVAAGPILAARAGVRMAPFSVHEIGLYASHLNPAGARYELLERYPLGMPFPGA